MRKYGSWFVAALVAAVLLIVNLSSKVQAADAAYHPASAYVGSVVLLFFPAMVLLYHIAQKIKARRAYAAILRKAVRP